MLKLAFRSVLAWRRSISASVAAIALACALITLAGSVCEPLLVAAREHYRIATGEYAGTLDADSAGRLRDAAASVGAFVSVGRAEPGVLDSGAGLLLVRVFRTDIDAELEYRGEPASQAVDRKSLLTTRESRPVTRVVAVGPGTETGPELLVEGSPDDSVVRVRGARGAMRRVAWVESFGLSETGWRTLATRRMRPLANAIGILIVALAGLTVGTLLPGQALLLRRSAKSLVALCAWGFVPRARTALMTLMGAIASLLAALAGSGVGLGAAAVMNARGRSALSLLPVELAIDVAGISALVTPSLAWAAGCVAASTLLGAVTALPAARIAGTLGPGRGLWQTW